MNTTSGPELSGRFWRRMREGMVGQVASDELWGRLGSTTGTRRRLFGRGPCFVIAFYATGEHVDDPRQWLDAAVQAAVLPSLEELEKTARDALDEVASAAKGGPFSS